MGTGEYESGGRKANRGGVQNTGGQVSAIRLEEQWQVPMQPGTATAGVCNAVTLHRSVKCKRRMHDGMPVVPVAYGPEGSPMAIGMCNVGQCNLCVMRTTDRERIV